MVQVRVNIARVYEKIKLLSPGFEPRCSICVMRDSPSVLSIRLGYSKNLHGCIHQSARSKCCCLPSTPFSPTSKGMQPTTTTG